MITDKTILFFAAVSRRARAAAFAVLLAAFSSSCPADLFSQTTVTAAEALAGVQKEFSRINDYRADLRVETDIPGVKTPPMEATLYFRKPDRMHLEARGFAMLPRDAVSFNPGVFTEDAYDATLQGEETVDGVRCLKIKHLAKFATLRLQRAMLFVDPTRMLVMKLNTDPAQGGSAEINIKYVFVQNSFFLPGRVIIEMAAAAAPRAGIPGKPPRWETGAQNSRGKKPRITMTYSNHVVNKGIPDAVFSKEKRR